MKVFSIVPLTEGRFAIDDGANRLAECPCCGKPLTQAGAETIVRNIEQSKLDFGELLLGAAFRKARTS